MTSYCLPALNFSSELFVVLSVVPYVNETLLSRLMIEFTDDLRIPDRWGYIYTGLLLIVSLMRSLLLHQNYHLCNKTGIRLRTALIAAVYRKVWMIYVVQSVKIVFAIFGICVVFEVE